MFLSLPLTSTDFFTTFSFIAPLLAPRRAITNRTIASSLSCHRQIQLPVALLPHLCSYASSLRHRQLAPIAKPLANKKLGKRALKLICRAAEDKCLKRGMKKVVKSIRHGHKGFLSEILYHVKRKAEEGEEDQAHQGQC